MNQIIIAAALDARDWACVGVSAGALIILAASWYADWKRGWRRVRFHRVPRHTRFILPGEADEGGSVEYVKDWAGDREPVSPLFEKANAHAGNEPFHFGWDVEVLIPRMTKLGRRNDR